MREKIIKIIKSPLLYLTLIAAVFFVAYSAPRFNTTIINSSPDENANYYFSRLVAEESTLKKYEPLNENIDAIVHPRSVNVNRDNYLVPGSFLGLPIIYGIIGKIFTPNIIIFLTPFFAVIASLFFYGIMKNIFSREEAFIASILMLANPVLWYYSTRSMFHNVLFLSLLIIGTFFLINAGLSRDAGALNSSEQQKDKFQISSFKFQNNIKYQISNFKKYIFLFLAGFFLGLALITRTAEAPWVILVLLILLVIYWKKIKIFEIFIVVVAIILVSLPILYCNQILYGSPFLTGYSNLRKNDLAATEVNDSNVNSEDKSDKCLINNLNGGGNLELSCGASNVSVPAENAQNNDLYNKIKKLVKNNIPANFVLHFNIKTVVLNFKNYFIDFFKPLSYLSFAGIIFLIIWLVFYKIKKGEDDEKRLKSKLAYLIIFCIVSAYLIIYYGSWIFYDTPDKTLITIGTSYTRYWLPVYIMSLPFISFLIVKISKIFKFSFPKFIFIFLCASVIVSYCGWRVLYAPYEGIIEQFKNMGEYPYKKELVLKLTEEDAVIVNQYYDKLFFPQRKVVASKMHDDENVILALASIVDRASVYYYAFNLKQEDIDYINRVKLADYGLMLTDGNIIFKDEELWRVIRK
ncbi:MAG: hypothetical protein V1655_01710 [bacterium]